jgi:hypothetical protein
VHSQDIEKLIAAIEAKHGPLSLYGSDPDEEHGICFVVPGTSATLSAHTQEGRLTSGLYDVQVESQPPGDYVHSALMTLTTVLDLVARLQGPEDGWPRLGGASRRGS